MFVLDLMQLIMQISFEKSFFLIDSCRDVEIIGKYNFKDVSNICLHLFLSFCLLWICIFMKDIWYKCKYQSCFQLFYPVLIREILQNFFLVEMYLTFALQYLSKWIRLLKWYQMVKYCGIPRLCQPHLRQRRIRRK